MICTSLDSVDSNSDFRSSAIRSEVKLESISHSMSHSKQISLNLNEHLSEIQQVVTRTHDAVLSQSAAIDCLSQSTLFNTAYHLTSLKQPTSLPISFSQGYEIAAVDIDSDPRRKHSFPTRGTTCPRDIPRERYECKFTTCYKIRGPTGIDVPKSVYIGPGQSFRKVFSRNVQYRSTTTNKFTSHYQLLRIHLFCRMQNESLPSLSSKIAQEMV